MLELNNNAVTETSNGVVQYNGSTLDGNTNCVIETTPYYYGSYPVYVYTDRTKKAIEVLKALEADGLKVQSVKKFIELVEKIAAIL